jgi:phosphopantetheinyl transferase
VEPTSNCSSASGGALFVGSAAIMQVIESQTLILYHTDLRGQWPEAAARAFAARLPYARRLALGSGSAAARASLAGIALALHALARLLGRRMPLSEILFAQGAKPRLAPPAALVAGDTRLAARRPARAAEGTVADFSISHTGRWVACAALAAGRVGLDLEIGSDERIAEWVLREAILKASGEGLRALREVQQLTVHEGRVRWRGESWHVRRLAGFDGASACIVCSHEVPVVASNALSLAELFVT